MNVHEADADRQAHQPDRNDRTCCGTCGDPWPCRIWRLAAIEIMDAVRDASMTPRSGDR